jgi:hypothetical protein
LECHFQIFRARKCHFWRNSNSVHFGIHFQILNLGWAHPSTLFLSLSSAPGSFVSRSPLSAGPTCSLSSSTFLTLAHALPRPPCAAAALLPPAACAQPGPLVSSPVPHPAFKASQWHKQFAQPYFLLSESSELFLSRHRCCQASSGDGLPRHFPTLTKPDF